MLVDEAHRLKRRRSLTSYIAHDINNLQLNLGSEATELDWILNKSRYQILFYDEGQSIKPSDIESERFDTLKSNSNNLVIPLLKERRI